MAHQAHVRLEKRLAGDEIALLHALPEFRLILHYLATVPRLEVLHGTLP